MKSVPNQVLLPGLPDPSQAHIWLLDLQRHRPDDYPSERVVLDDSELTRMAAFRRERDRQQYRLIRTTVRNVLSGYCPAVEPTQWRFNKNQHGKPAIAGPATTEPLFFNISHSGRWLAMAVACSENIGIDIEQVSDRHSALAIARRHFTRREYSELCDLAPQELLSCFYRLWVLKEAYSKACGNALVPTLGALEFSFPGEKSIVAGLPSANAVKQELPDWYFSLFKMAGYRLALAMRCRQGAGDLDVSAWGIDDPLEPGVASKLNLLPYRRSG